MDQFIIRRKYYFYETMSKINNNVYIKQGAQILAKLFQKLSMSQNNSIDVDIVSDVI